jgi:hypothetical protein
MDGLVGAVAALCVGAVVAAFVPAQAGVLVSAERGAVLVESGGGVVPSGGGEGFSCAGSEVMHADRMTASLAAAGVEIGGDGGSHLVELVSHRCRRSRCTNTLTVTFLFTDVGMRSPARLRGLVLPAARRTPDRGLGSIGSIRSARIVSGG